MLKNRSRVMAAAFAWIVWLVASGCGRHSGNSETVTEEGSENNIAPSTRFHLKEDELSMQVARALDGDQEAADRVFMHYTTVDPNDQETLLHWMRIAVENGSPGYMQLYALTLAKRGGPEACKRALFWLKRSSELAPSMSRRNEIDRQGIEQSAKCQVHRQSTEAVLRPDE